MLFFLPELQDNSDYKITVPTDEVQLVEERCCSQTAEAGCCEEFCELAKLVMEDEGLQYPFTAEKALFLYTRHQRTLEIYFDKHICYEKLQQRTVGFKASFYHVSSVNFLLLFVQ